MLPGDESNKASREGGKRHAWRVPFLLLIVPVLLFVPLVIAGERFLPMLPRGLEPLNAEDAAAGTAAMKDANYPQVDRVFPVLTDQLAISDELRGAHLPTWQPRQGLGTPLFAGTIAAAAYPPNGIGFLLPPDHVAGPLALLTLLLAGTGMWLFLRRLGLSRGACVVGALSMQLGGWGIANLFYYMKVDAALWIPWSLWAVEGIVRRKRGSGIALTLSIAFSLLAGFVPVAVFGIFLSALWALYRLTPLSVKSGETPPPETTDRPRSRAPRLVPLALFAALGLAAAMVQLLPTFEASRQSRRIDVEADVLAASALPTATLAGTVVPDFVGSPTEATTAGNLPVAWWLTPSEDAAKAETANQLEWNTYAGAVTVLLALVGLFAHSRRALFPALALLGVLGFACAWPGIRELYRLPGFNLGDPGRVLGLAWILWPWLAALGVEAVLRRRRRALEVLLIGAFVFAASSFFLWHGFEPERWAQQFEATMVERYVDDPAFGLSLEEIRRRIPPSVALEAGERLQRSFAHGFAASLSALVAAALAFLFDRNRRPFAGGTPAWTLWVGIVVLGICAVTPVGEPALVGLETPPPAALALGAVLFLALAGWRRAGVGKTSSWLPIAAAVAIEGILATGGHVTGRPASAGETFPPSEAIDAVRKAAGDGRVLRFDGSPSGIEEGIALARPNLLEAYGISDLTPYIVFTPASLIELMIAIEPEVYRHTYRKFSTPLRRVEDVDHPILDLVRAQCILAQYPLEHPRLDPVFSRPGFHVYRRLDTFPAARVVPEALASESDAEVLRRLHEKSWDLTGATLLAPEDAEHAAAAEGLGPDWQPGQLERVRRVAGNRIEYEIWGSSGGWLVMHEQTYPGWEARVNGEEVPVLRADHALRALRIPAGDCTVVLHYAPPSLRYGFLVSLTAIVLALLATRRFGW